MLVLQRLQNLNQRQKFFLKKIEYLPLLIIFLFKIQDFQPYGDLQAHLDATIPGLSCHKHFSI